MRLLKVIGLVFKRGIIICIFERRINRFTKTEVDIGADGKVWRARSNCVNAMPAAAFPARLNRCMPPVGDEDSGSILLISTTGL